MQISQIGLERVLYLTVLRPNLVFRPTRVIICVLSMSDSWHLDIHPVLGWGRGGSDISKYNLLFSHKFLPTNVYI